jgi:hypothetical protein
VLGFTSGSASITSKITVQAPAALTTIYAYIDIRLIVVTESIITNITM